MKKSINLYGEAFIKTIAYEKTGFGSADKGLELVKEFLERAKASSLRHCGSSMAAASRHKTG
jgi:hypothetical protein